MEIEFDIRLINSDGGTADYHTKGGHPLFSKISAEHSIGNVLRSLREGGSSNIYNWVVYKKGLIRDDQTNTVILSLGAMDGQELTFRLSESRGNSFSRLLTVPDEEVQLLLLAVEKSKQFSQLSIESPSESNLQSEDFLINIKAIINN